MKAFKMKDRPPFPLVRQDNAAPSGEYLQMPRWLVGEQNPLSLEATVAYTLLFNRMLLSKQSGWVNEAGEVFLIYTREELANTLKISYRKATAVFRELMGNSLIWEKRSGRGFPNQIYIAVPAEKTVKKSAEKPEQPSFAPFKNRQTDRSRTAGLSVQDAQDCPASNKDKSQQDGIQKEKSPSIAPALAREAVTDDGMAALLEQSEADSFPENVSRVFKSAIAKLYHAQSYRSDAGKLSGKEIKQVLFNLNSVVLDEVYDKIAAKKHGISRNPIGYVATALLNAAIADGGRSNRGIYDLPKKCLAGFSPGEWGAPLCY